MSRGRPLSFSSSSSRHRSVVVDRHSGKGSNTKCIITVGILLPLCAAVIGISAWSLTSESVRDNPQAASLIYHQDGYLKEGKHSAWFRERNDDLRFGVKLPIGASMNKHELGPDIVPDDDDLRTEVLPPPPPSPEAAAPETTDKDDPLYVVHYLPENKPKQGFHDRIKPHPDSVNVLSTILSNTKGKRVDKGTPQFIVIAPLPQREDEVDDLHEEEAEAVPRKKKKKGRESTRKDSKAGKTPDDYKDSSHFRHQVEPAPRTYASTDSQEHQDLPLRLHQAPHYQYPDPSQKQKQQINPPPPTFSHDSQRQDNYYHHYHHTTTPAPAPSVSIIMPSFGLLRSILRPKFDLKKKLFFGVQLENGLAFGGHTDAPPSTARPTTKPPYHGIHHGGGNHPSEMTLYK